MIEFIFNVICFWSVWKLCDGTLYLCRRGIKRIKENKDANVETPVGVVIPYRPDEKTSSSQEKTKLSKFEWKEDGESVVHGCF